MGRFIIVVVAVAGFLAGCAGSQSTAQKPGSDYRDTFAFAKYGKGVFFGVNAIVRSDSSTILVTNQDVYRSTNDGLLWESIAEPLPHKNITALMASNDTIYAGSSHGTVYKSTDHGLQWTVHQRTGSGAVRGFSRSTEVQQVDNLHTHVWPQTLELARHDSAVVQTNRFGVTRSITWQPVKLARACVATDSMVIVTSGESSILVYNLTTAICDTLKVELLQGQTISALALYHDTLYVGTRLALGGVFRVKLGTTAWEQMLLDRIEGALDVNTLMVNERAVYVASREHGVLYVPHGSNIMRSLSDGIHLGLHQSVSLCDSTWVVSSRVKGAIAMTPNGTGLRMLSSRAPSSPEYVVTAMHGMLIMGLADGSVYISPDRGATWNYRSSPFAQSDLTSLRVLDSTVYACTATGLFQSKDTARTFTSVTDALQGENVQSVARTDSLLLIFASSGTYTLDRDRRLGLFSPGVKADYQVRLNDAMVHNGVVLGVGYPGLFTSRDGGITWILTTIPKAMVLRTVYCDETSVYVVGDDGDIYVSPQPRWLRVAK